jgi:hypothetical protein
MIKFIPKDELPADALIIEKFFEAKQKNARVVIFTSFDKDNNEPIVIIKAKRLQDRKKREITEQQFILKATTADCVMQGLQSLFNSQYAFDNLSKYTSSWHAVTNIK